MEILYDVPIEVNKKQYNNLMTKCSGLIAGREHDGKYYIKVWNIKYIDYIKQVMNH